MRWITANDMQRWATGIQARTELPGLIKQLILASVSDMTKLRFPSGDNAQLPGWDGMLDAHPTELFKAYLPDGISAWETGTNQGIESKAEADYRKRTADPGPGVDPLQTTFVFVTPYVWTGATAWIAAKKKDLTWKDISVIDAIQLEDWFLHCPAVAAQFARENGLTPAAGALSITEFWETYSRQFHPPLKEAVLLAGREARSRELLGSLTESAGVQRWMGDSLDEVLGFVCATIMSAPEAERNFFLAHTMIVETEHAARQLRGKDGTIFALRGAAKNMAGSLNDQHRVILPVGRDSIRSAPSMTLPRATTFEMSEALKEMGMTAEKAVQVAHQCGRSVSVLARRIPSGDPAACSWRDDAVLLSAFLAGAWDHSCDADKVVMAALAGVQTYDEFESVLRKYLTQADGPLELVGSVWAVQAPVDMFAQMSHLLQESLWERLSNAVDVVLTELDPALELPVSERMYADLQGVRLRHSDWLRDGLATTLLIFAALGDQQEIMAGGLPPQEFVNRLVDSLPGLCRDHRLIASLSRQLPMLMEAAPDPLLSALEHLLEGDGARMLLIFQDSKESSSVWTSSPHTSLLWALEMIGRDPDYFAQTVMVLARLAAIDPGGQFSNRPLSSLQGLFCPWFPGTHASHEARIAVLEILSKQDPEVSWDLISKLLPEGQENRIQAPSPRFREAGASARETMTYPLLHKTHSWLTEKACELAGSDPQRWIKLIGKLRNVPESAHEHLIEALNGAMAGMTEEARSGVWRALCKCIRLHRTHSTADWALPESELTRLEMIAEAMLPKETGSRDEHLFRQQFPPFREVDAHRITGQVEEWRSKAVRKVLAKEGLEGVIRFAGRVEAAEFVGGSFGIVASEPNSLIEAIALSEAAPMKLPGFAASISGTARIRFGREWADMLREAIRSGRLTQALLIELAICWPHTSETWTWIASFGSDAENRYWKGKQAWGIAAEGPDLAYAVDMYLKNERPEYILESLGLQADRLAGRQWLEVLEAYRVRIISKPEAATGELTLYSIQHVFRFLQDRADVPMEQLALLEYSYLLVLRPSWRDADPNSALDKCLAQSPELFVRVLSDCFRPMGERGDVKPEPSPEKASRAKNAFHLLESFARVPGLVQGVLDADALRSWVGGVLDLASAADRRGIAEEYIGKLLARASNDPEDSLWPHRAIRDGLETWRSDRIEMGLHLAVVNGGGFTVRESLEGGQQERTLAKKWREDAECVQRWPRTRILFRRIAKDYERQGQMHDLHVEQLRLRG